MGIAVGIDLGTTNSAVAWVDNQGRATVLPNRLGAPITPSVICFRNGETFIGQEAKELQAAGEPAVAAFFKRQMGVANFSIVVDGKDYSPVDLSALLLNRLKEDAERVLKQPVTDAVITVPAYFRNPQREATIEAGKRAGLNILQIINEPTAAAVAYGLRGLTESQTLLVYDLGGGTFDVTVLRIAGDELRVLTSDGDHQLGGKDWDDRVVEFLGQRFREEFGNDPFEDAVSLSELLVRAEQAKRQLSAAQSTRLSVAEGGRRGTYELNRKTFDALTYDLMQRTISLTRKALDDAGVAASELSAVVLVGGSTRMPMVHEFIQRELGKSPVVGVNVDEAVALGAARIAAEWEQKRNHQVAHRQFRLPGLSRTIDVANHSLGMVAISEDRSAYVNSIILPKNTPVPCVQSRPYQHRMRRRGATFLEVFMTQGESSVPADVTYLGKYVICGFPEGVGEHFLLDIEYHYDVSGTVQVTASERQSKTALQVQVEPLPADVPDRFLGSPAAAVAPEHLTTYLAFDLSGSMSGRPLAEAQHAARGFLANVDLAHCSVGIVAFSDRTATKLAASQDARAIEQAIASLRVGETGGGNDTDPFSELLSLLAQPTGRRVAIVLADGAWSHQSAAIDRARRCHAAGIDVVAVGFGGANKDFLTAIASSADSSFFTGMEGLVDTFTSIAQVLTESGTTQVGLASPGAPTAERALRSFFQRS